MPSGEKQPAKVLSGEKQPVKMPSGGEQPAKVLSGEKQPVEVLSGYQRQTGIVPGGMDQLLPMVHQPLHNPVAATSEKSEADFSAHLEQNLPTLTWLNDSTLIDDFARLDLQVCFPLITEKKTLLNICGMDEKRPIRLGWRH
jgi:hypothetical protein